MIVDAPELSRLETLPPEILHNAVELLPLSAIKALSCASKRLREVCLPTLFRRVKFEFSEAGLEELKGIVKSTYAVPDLFVPGLLAVSKPSCI